MNIVNRTERGWAGHYICSHRCAFRRNTLLEKGDIRIVVSTVGLHLMDQNADEARDRFREVRNGAYFETMAFFADPEDTRYHDADTSCPLPIQSPCTICEIDADDRANDMHETIVQELTKRMEDGEFDDA